LNIAFVSGSIKGGGSERASANLSSALSRKANTKAFLFTGPALEGEYPLDTAVNRRCILSNSLRADVKAMRKAFAEEQIDVAVGMGIFANICVCLAKCSRQATRVVVSERNAPKQDHLSRKSKLARYLLYPRADGFVFQTQEAKNFYAAHLRGRGVVIPNPLPVEQLPEPYGDTTKKKNIVSVGRMMPQKNQALLLDAFSMIAGEFPDYRLTIYGDGPLRKALEEKTSALGLEGRVFLPGYQSDVLEQIRSAALFVLPSDFEGMPNALIEAMALGLPCISTDCPCGGPRSLIENGKNGMLVPAGDADAMARAMRELLREPVRAAEIGRNALKIRDTLAASRIAEQWIKYLEEACKC